MDTENKSLAGKIIKIDPVTKVVYGWAYVCKIGDKPVVDHSGDVIEPHELEKAAHDFVVDCREGKIMHDGDTMAELVESMFFSEEVQKALDIDLGKVGWFIGMRINDEELMEKIEKGELAMFSIGGSAIREVMNEN